jgi:hypothetical protein
MPQTKTGTFVHVVASVDLVNGTGKILYVNPSSVSTAPETPEATAQSGATPRQRFEISIQDAEGKELRRLHPTIQVSSCEADQQPKTGLISEDIPLVHGMRRLLLLYGGAEIGRFEAGERHSAAVSGMRPLTFDAPVPSKPQHRSISVVEAVPPKEGITYTVQVKPENGMAWQTIAVGRPTPNVQIDRNQFPGTRSARVRVLRSTGFEDEVFAEEDVDLTY